MDGNPHILATLHREVKCAKSDQGAYKSLMTVRPSFEEQAQVHNLADVGWRVTTKTTPEEHIPISAETHRVIRGED